MKATRAHAALQKYRAQKAHPRVALGRLTSSSLISAVVAEELYARGNEISCHPQARWLRPYRLLSVACQAIPCARTRLRLERTRPRLFRNRPGRSLLLRTRRVWCVV